MYLVDEETRKKIYLRNQGYLEIYENRYKSKG